VPRNARPLTRASTVCPSASRDKSVSAARTLSTSRSPSSMTPTDAFAMTPSSSASVFSDKIPLIGA
jgi:hypothetical protein